MFSELIFELIKDKTVDDAATANRPIDDMQLESEERGFGKERDIKSTCYCPRKDLDDCSQGRERSLQ